MGGQRRRLLGTRERVEADLGNWRLGYLHVYCVVILLPSCVLFGSPFLTGCCIFNGIACTSLFTGMDRSA